MKKKTIAVSDLAMFYTDEKGFVARQGKAANLTKAKEGTAFHNRAGKTSMTTVLITFGVLLLCLAYIYFSYPLLRF